MKLTKEQMIEFLKEVKEKGGGDLTISELEEKMNNWKS